MSEEHDLGFGFTSRKERATLLSRTTEDARSPLRNDKSKWFLQDMENMDFAGQATRNGSNNRELTGAETNEPRNRHPRNR